METFTGVMDRVTGVTGPILKCSLTTGRIEED